MKHPVLTVNQLYRFDKFRMVNQTETATMDHDGANIHIRLENWGFTTFLYEDNLVFLVWPSGTGSMSRQMGA